MPPHSGEITHEKRVAIVALQLLGGFKFADIADKLGLETGTLNRVY